MGMGMGISSRPAVFEYWGLYIIILKKTNTPMTQLVSIQIVAFAKLCESAGHH